MELPLFVVMSLSEHGLPPRNNTPAIPTSGGMVAQSARVETYSGPIFVKWKDDSPDRFFESEADGLNRLRATNTLRMPEVLLAYDASHHDREGGWQSVLALEWIEERSPTRYSRFCEDFAAGLARMHRNTSPQNDCFGLEINNYLGSQPQDNTWKPSWPQFYRDLRVTPQMERAKTLGLLPPYRERLIRDVCDRMEDLMHGLEARPCLIHGDLWSGNFLTAGDEAVLIDPAVHYAEREVEMAFVELFGGFPDGFMPAYYDCYPLDDGYEYRRLLHQLYPLLIHLNHFGETYGPAVDRACRYYLT